jgi:type I restriction enzyme, S subunit
MSEVLQNREALKVRRFQPYPAYKPSGVEWFGDVPKHWERMRLREAVTLVNGFPFDAELFGRGGGAPLVRIRDIFSATTEVCWTGDWIKSAEISNGDILVGMDGDFNVSRWHGGRALLNQRVCCLRAKEGRLEQKYLFYSIPFPLNQLNDITYSTTVKHLSSLDVMRFTLYVPSVSEQLAIAEFLDRETAKIDVLIANKRALIEKLTERRSALISHTITRGLPPDAACAVGFNSDPPLKPSGVEWIGDIPATWELRKLGYVSVVVRGASPRPAGDERYFNGDFIPWITVGELTKDDSMYLASTQTMLTRDGAERSRVIPNGTLVLTNSGATLGVPKILSITGCANDGIVAFLNLRRDASKQFLYYYLSSLTENLRDRIKQGSGQPNLNTEIIKALAVPWPPTKSEQDAIAAYLAGETTKLYALVAEIEAATENLYEYRTALITAAVTGKIDVRGAVA